MLLWFTDLMNVTREVTIHRPNVSTLLSSAYIRGNLNATTRGPFISSLISCLFSDEVQIGVRKLAASRNFFWDHFLKELRNQA